MAITLLNNLIAVSHTKSLSDTIWQGQVRKLATGITGITLGDVLFFDKSKGVIITVDGQEFILIKLADVMGKVT